jgi:hypothetical protein
VSKRIASFHAFKQSRWYRRLLWTGAAFLAYVLVGFFVLPPIIKSQMGRVKVASHGMLAKITLSHYVAINERSRGGQSVDCQR